MPPEVLENIFVQRQELAQQLVERIREAVLSAAKYHTLLTGPRGIGKTHLVSLVYHRIREVKDLQEHILIAWLSEEEWSVTSFLDLLLCIFQALREESHNTKGAQPCIPSERVESLYEMPVDAAESAGTQLLKEFIGDSSNDGEGKALPCPYTSRTLLLIIENLDDLFAGLGKDGQKQLRAFLEENNCIILATAQSYFKDVKQKNSPFDGFFWHEELRELNTDEATQLLANIAKLKGNSELERFIRTQTGRDRIKAVHFLAGGNHRLYVIFSEFLTHQESLDQLVDAFMRTLDDLTPYYQERMRFLSPQQRKIIDFLCDRRHAVTVKEIAQRCFMTHQTASSQLKKLLEMGYVRSEPIGRESYYEFREPLMRFCLEVKKQRGEPIQLFVDFLRLWYTRTELQQRLELKVAEIKKEQASDASGKHLSAGLGGELLHEQSHPRHQQRLEALPVNGVLEREYLLYALQTTEQEEEDPRVAAYLKECKDCFEKKDYVCALQIAEKLIAIRGQAQDWLLKGRCSGNLDRYEAALASFNKAIEFDPNYANAWFQRGVALYHLQRYQEALVSFDKGIELDSINAWAWSERGGVLSKLQYDEEALVSVDKALELDPNYAWAWAWRGLLLDNLQRYKEALVSYDKALALKLNYAWAWANRGWSLDNLGRHQEALTSYDTAIELDSNDVLAWVGRGDVLKTLKRYEEALASYDKALKLDPNCFVAWIGRGNLLNLLKRYEEALASYDKALKLGPNYFAAWIGRGNAMNNLQRYEEALASYDQAVELDPNYTWVWNVRGNILNILKRYKEALASYDQAVELDPNDSFAWNGRGNALNILQRYEEALVSYDKAIELAPNHTWVWTMRGVVLNTLNCYEEALASYDKAIELDSNDKSAWRERGRVLINLGHYDQALTSYDKAISLGTLSSSVFCDRAEALLALNRWDEASAALDYAYVTKRGGEKASTTHLPILRHGFIIRHLLDSTHDATVWKTRIKDLIAFCKKHGGTSALGQGLVHNIPRLMSQMVSDKAAQTWLEVWRELTSDRPEFHLPLRLLNAAVRYRATKGDRRVLLELPIEERNLLKPLLDISEEEK